jgi:excisionase family DNA binding protein
MSQGMPSSNRGRLLPTNVVAGRLGKSERTVRWYVTRGWLRATRDGVKLLKFYESDVEAFKRARVGDTEVA